MVARDNIYSRRGTWERANKCSNRVNEMEESRMKRTWYGKREAADGDRGVDSVNEWVQVLIKQASTSNHHHNFSCTLCTQSAKTIRSSIICLCFAVACYLCVCARASTKCIEHQCNGTCRIVFGRRIWIATSVYVECSRLMLVRREQPFYFQCFSIRQFYWRVCAVGCVLKAARNHGHRSSQTEPEREWESLCMWFCIIK